MAIELIVLFVCLCGGAYSQSVAQQCLTEQLRNNPVNPNNNNNVNNVNVNQPAVVTMAAFDAICSNYPAYVNCFDTRLPLSRNAADVFLSLVLTTDSMTRAYNGLCNQDLEELRQHVRCLLSTPQIRQCYDTFNRGVNQVINFQNQRVPRVTLQPLACNVSVDRYRCETAVYGICNRRAGQIMQDFFFAGLSDDCQRITGVTSPFNGGPATVGMMSQGTLLLMFSIVVFLSSISLG